MTTAVETWLPWAKAEFNDARFRRFAILAFLNAFLGPEGLGGDNPGHAEG